MLYVKYGSNWKVAANFLKKRGGALNKLVLIAA